MTMSMLIMCIQNIVADTTIVTMLTTTLTPSIVTTIRRIVNVLMTTNTKLTLTPNIVTTIRHIATRRIFTQITITLTTTPTVRALLSPARRPRQQVWWLRW